MQYISLDWEIELVEEMDFEDDIPANFFCFYGCGNRAQESFGPCGSPNCVSKYLDDHPEAAMFYLDEME